MSVVRIGADYYPEHWNRERWEKDAKLMQEAGFNITRLAEFSWVKLEPEEDKYDFTWLDEAVEVLGKYGIACILCTPTPTIPKWLYDKYPEVIQVNSEGHRRHFGNRQNTCFTNKTFRYFSQKITRALAEHFRYNPNVIGWQLDNELHGPFCFCQSCENSFRKYLKDKFNTIEALNEAYGTIFWSQTYGGFDEVHLPRHSNSNLSLMLDYHRFFSDQVVAFAKEQTDILREVCPDHFVTHNYMGFAQNVDYFKLAEMLDFVSHDYYYNGGSWDERFGSYKYGAAALDLMRGCKKKHFYIMENSAGPVGWESFGRNLRPGEMRRMTFQNLAHGANGQIWFRWRTCRYGTEQYWHGILGHDGVPGRRYNEAKQTAFDLHKAWDILDGGEMKSEVAFVLDYNDRWALEQQRNNRDFDYIDGIMPYYKALSKKSVNIDYLRECDSLDEYKKYKIIIAPYKYILTEEYADKLKLFVQNGGILLTTCRSGVKNTDNVPHAMMLPGYLRELAGLRVEEYESIPKKKPYKIISGGENYEGSIFADWIVLETAEAIAKFNEHDINFPAAAKNNFGNKNGKVYYIGTIPDEKLTEKIIDEILEENKIKYIDLPENCEAVTWNKADVDYILLINHTTEEKAFNNISGVDLLADKKYTDNNKLILEPNGVAIIKQ